MVTLISLSTWKPTFAFAFAPTFVWSATDGFSDAGTKTSTSVLNWSEEDELLLTRIVHLKEVIGDRRFGQEPRLDHKLACAKSVGGLLLGDDAHPGPQEAGIVDAKVGR